MEQLFSAEFLAFFEAKGYDVEAEYVCLVWNWWRASDERGLTSAQRTQYYKALLHYMLDELIPWHVQAELQDLSLLEVNQ